MIRSRTAILVLLTGLNLLNYIDRYVLAAVLDDVQKELSLSNFEAGLLATAFLVGYFVTSPWFGARADRGGRKGLIAFGVVVWSVATAATGLSHGLLELVVARVFVGIGEASYATLAPTIIDDITPPESKNRTLAVFYLAIPVGSALGYIMGGTIDHHWNWRAAFFVAGGPGIVLALLCLLIVEPPRKLATVKANMGKNLTALAAIPLFRRAVMGACAYTAALGAFSYWAPKYLLNEFPHELTKQSANTWFGTITVVSGIVGTILGGRLGDRVLRHNPVATGSAHDARDNRRAINGLLRVCALGMIPTVPLAAAAFWVPWPVAFFAFAFLAEIGLFLSTSPVNAIALRSVPVEMRASAMAAQIFAIHLFGDLWSPPALGKLLDRLPSSVALMALPVTFAIAAWLWWPRAREAE